MSNYRNILAKAAKNWNCPDLFSSVKKDVPKIPFSAPMLNWATYGGIARQRVTEFLGAPGGGKSSSAIDLCYNAHSIFEAEHAAKIQEYREAIAKGKKELSGPLEDLIESGPKNILYADLEHSFDFKWANKMGLTEDMADIMQPPDLPAEEILNMILDTIQSNECGLVIIDSIPSLVPKSELEKKLGERTVAALAGLMTIFLRKVVPMLTKYDCTLLLINQTRPNMENPYVINSPGGEAIKFYSSTRILFRLGSPVDFAGNELPMSTENPNGYLVTTKLLKQKAAAFDRKVASYFLMADSGIRPDFDYAKLAINKYGIVRKGGAWFTMCDPFTGEILEDETGKPVKVNGVLKVYDYLAEHVDYYNKIKAYITADINGTEVDMSELVPEDEADVIEEPAEGDTFNPEEEASVNSESL